MKTSFFTKKGIIILCATCCVWNSTTSCMDNQYSNNPIPNEALQNVYREEEDMLDAVENEIIDHEFMAEIDKAEQVIKAIENNKITDPEKQECALDLAYNTLNRIATSSLLSPFVRPQLNAAQKHLHAFLQAQRNAGAPLN